MWVRRLLHNDQLLLALLAVVVGVCTGGAVILLREGMDLIQALSYGSDTEYLGDLVRGLPWWQVILVPTAGGLIVGITLKFIMPNGRPQGVADVIESCAMHGSKMNLKAGLGAAVASALSVGVGGSVGREGPAVHLGATVGAWIAAKLHLTRSLSRTLLGCGVASAVAASFNAPLAGALFANEVVVGHYGLSAFAPIVISSVSGTMVSRAMYGDFPAFMIGEHPIGSALEFPAFAGLGVVCGLIAVAFLFSVRRVEMGMDGLSLPRWIRPALIGAVIGGIALFYPEVLGVGYGTTDKALNSQFPLQMLIILAAAKFVATALCLGGGFAGGVFSPSLVLGALVGGAYGAVAAGLYPELSAGGGAYVLVGMGAMASAILGAPISTTLIVFELTGDYALTMAVMIGAVMASVMIQQLHSRSFFHWQLSRRGLDLHGGFASALLRGQTVATVMTEQADVVPEALLLPGLRQALQQSSVGELFVIGNNDRLIGTVTLADMSEAAFDPSMDLLVNAGDTARRKPPVLCPTDDLERALKLMHDRGEETIAVVADRESMRFLGLARVCDVMAAYNRALIEARAEERA
ncbi:Putative Cl-channel, voltage-gated family protein [clcB] fused to a CBS domain [Magnetospira sp. QH-2]|nr:Putative Cl-channel, voltage-gated family protein [clcB] fused to a CBS domain [Magnetospira sp. QH-2]